MEFKNIFTKKYIHPRDKETQNVEGGGKYEGGVISYLQQEKWRNPSCLIVKFHEDVGFMSIIFLPGCS